MDRTSKSVDEHLGSLKSDWAADVRALDEEISRRMPDAERILYEGRLWGGSDQQIIGYGVVDYTNTSGDSVEWFLVGLAQQKNYISVYVNAVEDGTYLLRQYEGKLGLARVGSAVVSFDSIEKVDLANLFEMIERAGRSGQSE